MCNKDRRNTRDRGKVDARKLLDKSIWTDKKRKFSLYELKFCNQELNAVAFKVQRLIYRHLHH